MENKKAEDKNEQRKELLTSIVLSIFADKMHSFVKAINSASTENKIEVTLPLELCKDVSDLASLSCLFMTATAEQKANANDKVISSMSEVLDMCQEMMLYTAISEYKRLCKKFNEAEVYDNTKQSLVKDEAFFKKFVSLRTLDVLETHVFGGNDNE